MNKWIGMGRLTKDPETRYTSGEDSKAITRFTLAVDRKHKAEGLPTADFIQCVAFGKMGEFAQKYFTKGMKIIVTARVQTGSYTDNDGKKVYTTDFIIEEQNFCESKSNREARDEALAADSYAPNDGFMNVDGSADDLPFQ